MNSPIYIFDLDGTLSLTDHRSHILKNGSNPNRWRDFFEACDKDAPNLPVIKTMESLRKAGARILIFSGRSSSVRSKTVRWLTEHTSFEDSDLGDGTLTMRNADDFTPDDILKECWLNNMLDADRERVVAVFDDRDKVVKMWRRNGIPCFQVAPGNF